MKLPHFIAIAGVVCAIFAVGIPYLSALGIWLGVSTILSMIYIVVAIVLSFKDGNVLDSTYKPHNDSIYTTKGTTNNFFSF